MIRTPARKRYAAPKARSAKRGRAIVRRPALRNFGLVSVPRVIGTAFPPRLRNTLRYCENFSLSVVTGNGYYAHSVNGLFKPNQNAAGHQPLYFDQLTPVYDFYHVVGAKATWKFHGAGTTNNIIFVCYVDDDNSPATGSAGMYPTAERKGAKSQPVDLAVTVPKPMMQTWSAQNWFGPNPEANPDLKGTAAGNPGVSPCFIMAAFENGGSTSFGCLMTIEIEYDVIWSSLVSVGAS